MLKYNYKKIIAKMQEMHINIKDLIEHPAMYRWNDYNIYCNKEFTFYVIQSSIKKLWDSFDV